MNKRFEQSPDSNISTHRNPGFRRLRLALTGTIPLGTAQLKRPVIARLYRSRVGFCNADPHVECQPCSRSRCERIGILLLDRIRIPPRLKLLTIE